MQDSAPSNDFDERRGATQFHPSRFEDYRLVYPVVSRRAQGVSIGANLSPTKLCNFRCVYCQVARGERAEEIERALNVGAPVATPPLPVVARFDAAALKREALQLGRAALDGALFETTRFADVPDDRRVLRDFAFSGDGEPTLSPFFPQGVEALAQARDELGCEAVKLVLITNATRLTAPPIVEALDRMTQANGEIWAKLDGVDASSYRAANRSLVPFETILSNLRFAARRWGVKIQSALWRRGGEAPLFENVDRYCALLTELSSSGRVFAAQLYTVARAPAESDVEPLTNAEMDAFAARVREETGIPIEVFYSR